jgi:hypothetical protein
MAVGMLPREMSVAIPATEREMAAPMLAAADEGMGAERHSEASCLHTIRAICKHRLMSKSQGLTLQSSDTLRRWRPTREREREGEGGKEGRRATAFLLHTSKNVVLLFPCSCPFSFSFFFFFFLVACVYFWVKHSSSVVCLLRKAFLFLTEIIRAPLRQSRA